MEENYLISIVNRQCVEGQVEETALTTTGTYTQRNGKRYIIYREYDQESQVSQTSTLKIEKDSVSLIRNHSNCCHTNLILENGKRHLCQYGTPYGDITLGVFTTKLVDALHDRGGDLTIEYLLDVNTSLSSINQITISVREADPATN